MSTSQMQGHRHGHQALDKSWSTISVRDFFEQIPWTGVPENISESVSGSSSTDTTEANSLNLKLKVSEYFNRFPWDGQPDIAVPLTPVAIQPDLSADNDITLEGFADLF